jgi:hypothetical protein
MSSESSRIADQLRRAFAGDAWHGPPLSELLTGITAVQAWSRPLPAAHSIGELALHITVWTRAAIEAAHGIRMPAIVGTERDWPNIKDDSGAEWTRITGDLFETGEQLARVIENFDDERLREIVPGREYDFYYLLHGIVQHSLYHGGQIALLRKAVGGGE